MAESAIIIQPDNAVKLFEYLGKKYIKKDEINEEKTITNTRIGGGKDSGISGGSYYIPENEYSNFMKKIYRDVIMKNGKEYLTEAQLQTGGPIAVDIDLRFTYETTNRLYTKDHIEDLMNCYFNVFDSIVDICNKGSAFCPHAILGQYLLDNKVPVLRPKNIIYNIHNS